MEKKEIVSIDVDELFSTTDEQGNEILVHKKDLILKALKEEGRKPTYDELLDLAAANARITKAKEMADKELSQIDGYIKEYLTENGLDALTVINEKDVKTDGDDKGKVSSSCWAFSTPTETLPTPTNEKAKKEALAFKKDLYDLFKDCLPDVFNPKYHKGNKIYDNTELKSDIEKFVSSIFKEVALDLRTLSDLRQTLSSYSSSTNETIRQAVKLLDDYLSSHVALTKPTLKAAVSSVDLPKN